MNKDKKEEDIILKEIKSLKDKDINEYDKEKIEYLNDKVGEILSQTENDKSSHDIRVDLFLYGACIHGIVVPNSDKILSDDFDNFASVMDSNKFWKMYYYLYQNNPTRAEQFREERENLTDFKYNAYEKNPKTAYAQHVNVNSLIERFVGDLADNFYRNYQIILNAKEDGIETEIPQKEKEIFDTLYNFFINKKEIKKTEILNYYKVLKEDKSIDLNSSLYDALLKCRTATNNKLVEQCLQVKDIINSANFKTKNNVKVFEGKELKDNALLVHAHDISQNSVQELHEFFDNIAQKEDPYLMSMSVINNKSSLNVYGNSVQSVLFGFTNIEADRIGHICEEDSFSIASHDGRQISKYPQYLSTPEKLIKNTKSGYNEVNYVCPEKYFENKLKPDYIVVNDENISEIYYDIAKSFNIPILHIPQNLRQKSNEENSNQNDKTKDEYYTSIKTI